MRPSKVYLLHWIGLKGVYLEWFEAWGEGAGWMERSIKAHTYAIYNGWAIRGGICDFVD
jgi:hypothetical protein